MKPPSVRDQRRRILLAGILATSIMAVLTTPAISKRTAWLARDGHSKILFSDRFRGRSLGAAWTRFLTSRAADGQPWNGNGRGGSGEGCRFDGEYFLPDEVSVHNGLSLSARRIQTPGVCAGRPYTFGWSSAAITTYRSFQFDGGYLDVDMKAPSGKGMWPGIWLLPGKGCHCKSDDFELDVQEGGYLGDARRWLQTLAWHLHDNADNRSAGGVVNTGVNLAAGFHHYGVAWFPRRSVVWYLDGRAIASTTSASVPIPNEPMEVVLSLGVANAASSGWHTVASGETSSPSTMNVASVVVSTRRP